MFQWYRNWRRDRILARNDMDDGAWSRLLDTVAVLRRFDAPSRNRLRELVVLFLHEKSIEPTGGLELDAHARRLIALQACLPILGLGIHWYRGWHSVIVYPGDFRVNDHWVDEDGIEHQVNEVRAGEAWPEGPVILSWEDDDRDANVIVHEFAHKLDMVNGVANGMPPLHADMDRMRWTRVFTDAYEDFTARVEAHEVLPFDAYAATDPAEFFAVASEVFLLTPEVLHRVYPDVWRELCAFYRQEPGRRMLDNSL